MNKIESRLKSFLSVTLSTMLAAIIIFLAFLSVGSFFSLSLREIIELFYNDAFFILLVGYFGVLFWCTILQKSL